MLEIAACYVLFEVSTMEKFQSLMFLAGAVAALPNSALSLTPDIVVVEKSGVPLILFAKPFRYRTWFE